MDADMRERGAQIWSAVQGDPTLLDGLTYGELMDLCDVVGALMREDQNLMRGMSVGLIRRLTGASEFDEQFQVMREIVGLADIRAALDVLDTK